MAAIHLLGTPLVDRVIAVSSGQNDAALYLGRPVRPNVPIVLAAKS